MGLFSKNKTTAYDRYIYRVYMNQSGKAADEYTESVDVTDDSEFLAVRAAEKRFPNLKVARVERTGVIPGQQEH